MQKGIRKLIFHGISQVLASLACMTGHLSGAEFVSFTMFNAGYFAGANGFEHYTNSKKGKEINP